jgi:hypothetical protein
MTSSTIFSFKKDNKSVMSEVLCISLTEFGIPTKPVWLIEMLSLQVPCDDVTQIL